LIWINFDLHALLSLFHKALGKFVADVDEIRPQYQDSEVNSSAVFASSLVRSIGPSVGSIMDQIDNMSLQEVGGLGFGLFPACLPPLQSTTAIGDDFKSRAATVAARRTLTRWQK
jgi:hypothetical protein